MKRVRDTAEVYREAAANNKKFKREVTYTDNFSMQLQF